MSGKYSLASSHVWLPRGVQDVSILTSRVKPKEATRKGPSLKVCCGQVDFAWKQPLRPRSICEDTCPAAKNGFCDDGRAVPAQVCAIDIV